MWFRGPSSRPIEYGVTNRMCHILSRREGVLGTVELMAASVPAPGAGTFSAGRGPLLSPEEERSPNQHFGGLSHLAVCNTENIPFISPR